MTVHTVGEFVAVLAIVVPISIILVKVIVLMTDGNFSICDLFRKEVTIVTYKDGYRDHKHEFQTYSDECPDDVARSMCHEWANGCDACFRNKVAKELREAKALRDHKEAQAKLEKVIEKELKKKKRAKK